MVNGNLGLQVNQIQGIVFQNQFFLFRRNIRPLADAAHGFRERGIEVRVVRRHENVGLADLGQRQRQPFFIGLTGPASGAMATSPDKPVLTGCGRRY